jgi:orotate phosphoribosyltransferase
VITSGNTVREVVDYLRSHGAVPAGICVLFDKRDIKEVKGVPVHALVRISRID